MVTTANYRCLGFLDAKGNWRHSFNQTILSDVVTWEAIGSALN
ncbi:MAG: hypothetical protein JWM68_3265 [Verrucomicrobiales bacterium]|nr:hypothetical protein [Verrucomicrobiales bacterium]